MELSEKHAKRKAEQIRKAKLESIFMLLALWSTVIIAGTWLTTGTIVVSRLPGDANELCKQLLTTNWMWILVLIANSYGIRHHNRKLDKLMDQN